MNEWMNERKNDWMNEWMDERMNGWRDKRINEMTWTSELIEWMSISINVCRNENLNLNLILNSDFECHFGFEIESWFWWKPFLTFDFHENTWFWRLNFTKILNLSLTFNENTWVWIWVRLWRLILLMQSRTWTSHVDQR